MINNVIDLSHWESISSYSDILKDGINGIIHKATQDSNKVDETYAERAKATRKAGLMSGAYHFANGDDGVGQAKFFLDKVQPDERTLLCLDFEPNPHGKTMTIAGARHFVSHIYAETGRWPVLYSGHLVKELLGNKIDPVLANCPLWLAQYSNTPVFQKTWKTWTLWQYTDGKIGPGPYSVKGVGPCDRNKFNGDLNALRKLWGYPPL